MHYYSVRKCVGMYKRSFTASERMVDAGESVRKICVAASTGVQLKEYLPDLFPPVSERVKGRQAWNDVSQEDRKTEGLYQRCA